MGYIYGVSFLWLFFIGSRRTLITKYPPVYSFIYYINYACQCKLNFVYLEGPILGIQFRQYEIMFKETTFVTFTWMNSLGEYFKTHWIMNERIFIFIRMFRVFVFSTHSFVTSFCTYIWREKKSIFTNTNVFIVQSISR